MVFFRKEPLKQSQVTPPVIDPGTVRLVAQRLNHYGTPFYLVVQYVFMKLVSRRIILCATLLRRYFPVNIFITFGPVPAIHFNITPVLLLGFLSCQLLLYVLY